MVVKNIQIYGVQFIYSYKAEIDLILNIWFTCIRLKLSCTIHPHTLIKSKIGGKILSQKHAKTNFYC